MGEKQVLSGEKEQYANIEKSKDRFKSLGKSLSSVRGFAGATDLGDQEVALVLDAPALFSEYFEGPEALRALESRP